ncbi:hypothetical protein FAF44_16830 [Nonomuraea sp. MG754425]|uniref:hypothetical protein n=1 Tax=Nonomuraea sp. MG754425 TaxID=2570319 RepID=UPI001F305933|nr:hypothetical protein [Nonomuraea sp. MG754425]MCF6470047.1 hypothetical protein [Nonomuraea sp. MG754425]
MHMRSRRRIMYAALAGTLALGGTGLTIGAATAQLDTDDPDLTMVEKAAQGQGDPPLSAASEESEEISVADEADDPDASADPPDTTDTDSDVSEETADSPADSPAEVSADEVEEATDESADESADGAIDEEEPAATAATGEETRCPFTTIYRGSVKQMLTKREGGARTKAYDAGEKTRAGKSRNIVTIGIGFNLSRGDARTIVNRILSETSPQSAQAAIKSGKAFDDLKAGLTALTDEQVSMLFEVSYEEAKDLVTRRGIENFDKLPRAVQAALIDVAYLRPGNINDIADEVNLATQAALAKKQPLSGADLEPAAKRLETFGKIAAKRGQGGNKIRFDEDAAMLRNKC